MTALIDRPSPAVGTVARFSAMVVVADQRVREAVVHGLLAQGAREVEEAASVAEARARARGRGPRELCVIDVALPDGSGIGLLAELRNAGWVRGVVLSSAEDPYTVRAALGAGVRGFLVTGALMRAQASSYGIGVAMSSTVQHNGHPSGPEALSARELDVLRLVADGRSNKDVGGQLGLSALTVKSHLARIARKIGTGDRAEMVALALRAGVIG